MANDVLVITEHMEGKFRKVSLEALTLGRRLAGDWGGRMAAVVLGDSVAELAEECRSYGADVVWMADSPFLREFSVEAYTRVVAALMTDAAPAVVVTGGTTRGRELAARLAARFDAAAAMDCTAVRKEGDDLIVTRPMYGGKVFSEVRLKGAPRIIGIRPNAFPAAAERGQGAVKPLPVPEDAERIRFVEKHLESGKMELTEAEIVVSGGRGMGGPDYAVLEALAKVLNGAVGASRSAVDEGWRPHSDQVGQTGKVVSPALYIACGISGAIQHLAGMSASKVIVAINKDPDAPIFSRADYCVTGDLFALVPAITEEIRKLKS